MPVSAGTNALVSCVRNCLLPFATALALVQEALSCLLSRVALAASHSDMWPVAPCAQVQRQMAACQRRSRWGGCLVAGTSSTSTSTCACHSSPLQHTSCARLASKPSLTLAGALQIQQAGAEGVPLSVHLHEPAGAPAHPLALPLIHSRVGAVCTHRFQRPGSAAGCAVLDAFYCAVCSGQRAGADHVDTRPARQAQG
jgi:hypothetical protein